ncbi:MAG: DUF2852 domain-containing protein [Parvibaculum sp.]|uniref:DUF2852 domain-containing protein n=1 Tax=Parvibaculum sp. TaxID=2024848 RepID=UPI0025ECF136|nr:DUF2852 domain-containing protein [Parvibaculum sp.]MCE9649341.1 DUF2852 domain-containing protein [Parvibaculum sp.]
MPTAAMLDDMPKGAWIALMVIGFVLFWPVGLGVLFYLIWSGKMQAWKRERGYGCSSSSRFRRHSSTGNSAFDAYRDETLKRMEEEQKAFGEFVDRLRRAKDQSEFDQFMAERRTQGGDAASA